MQKTTEMVKALADRNRLRIVGMLMQERELCACQITELLGVTGATASRHLAQLVHAGILQSRKDGRWMHYRLTAGDRRLQPLLGWLQGELADSAEYQADCRELAALMECNPAAICRRQRGRKTR